MSEKIVFTMTDTEEEVEFYVVEQTQINNINYILVTDSQDEEAEALILKETFSETGSEEAIYEIVEDDTELSAISQVFAEILEDVNIEM